MIVNEWLYMYMYLSVGYIDQDIRVTLHKSLNNEKK